MSDLLRLDYINSLPQPFIVHQWGGSEWPLHDIDVETGLMHIDVCGMLDLVHIRDVRYFRDAEGVIHDAETFYVDYVDGPQSGVQAAADGLTQTPIE